MLYLELYLYFARKNYPEYLEKNIYVSGRPQAGFCGVNGDLSHS